MAAICAVHLLTPGTVRLHCRRLFFDPKAMLIGVRFAVYNYKASHSGETELKAEKLHLASLTTVAICLLSQAFLLVLIMHSFGDINYDSME